MVIIAAKWLHITISLKYTWIISNHCTPIISNHCTSNYKGSGFSKAVLAEFKTIDGSARWPTINFNQTSHKSTVVISDPGCSCCSSCPRLCSRGWNISIIVKKPHRLRCHLKLTSKIKLLILWASNILLKHAMLRTIRNIVPKITWFLDICIVSYHKKVTDLTSTLVLIKLRLA